MQARHNFQKRISLDFIAQKEVKTTLIMGNYKALEEIITARKFKFVTSLSNEF